ncbi:MAG: CNNM domain-containing protein [Alistipes sp.]
MVAQRYTPPAQTHDGVGRGGAPPADERDLLLATILVVNNLVNICIVILTSSIIDSVFTFLRFEFLFKTVLVTFLLLLFGEILPKVLAQTIPCASRSSPRGPSRCCGGFSIRSPMRWCGRAAASARGFAQERDFARRAGRRGGHDPEFES